MTQYDSDPAAPLEEVFSSIDPTEVRMAGDLLAEGGIEAFVFDGAMSRMLGSTPAIPARLMVRAHEAVEARERLKELGFAE